MSDTTATEELFLPEPLPREVKYTVISVDDHVVEPPHTFEGRLPAHLQDRAPHVVDTPQGHQVWEFEGQKFTQVGHERGRGPPTEPQKMEPFRFDADAARAATTSTPASRDMDINGVWAAVNFPSMITGFCGRVFFNAQDRELGQACIRAWNDWLFEEWYVAAPDADHPARHHVPLRPRRRGRRDPPQRRARLHRRSRMPERPAPHRAPRPLAARPLGPDHPGVRRHRHRHLACTSGSSGGAESPGERPRLQLGATLFGQLSLHACAEWLWSEYPVKHPTSRSR